MRFYVVQVETRGEERFLAHLTSRAPEIRERFLWLRRSLRVRRKGRWHDTLAPVFPGYLFVQFEQVTPELYRTLRGIPGFLHFLRSNEEIVPLSRRDMQLIRHFMSFGEVVRRSTVYFDENNRIRVISGPLKGLEGRIVKVDRRKGRARVVLDLYEESFTVDFGFESLEPAPVGESAGAPAGERRGRG